MNQPSFSLYWL